MTRNTPITFASMCVLVTLAAAGCKTSPEAGATPAVAHHAGDPDDPLSAIMRRKLDLAGEVMAGLVTEDYPKIESNAQALRRLSEGSAWMVTDSVTYVVMSDEFRGIVSTMADHARARDLAGATADFARMTGSCVTCHQYLRRELFERDLPGKISGGGVEPLAALTAGGR